MPLYRKNLCSNLDLINFIQDVLYIDGGQNLKIRGTSRKKGPIVVRLIYLFMAELFNSFCAFVYVLDDEEIYMYAQTKQQVF